MLITYRLDFGPEFSRGIVTVEPPRVGKAFAVRAPAVDQDGNNRAGIRLPEIQVPLATYGGWNYRTAAMGLPDQLSGEAGSFYPFPRTRAEREARKDPRLSIEERYASRNEYLEKINAAARQLIADGFLLQADLQDVIDRSLTEYDWFTRR